VATDGSVATEDDPGGSASGSGTWCAEVELSGTPRVRAVLPADAQRRARVLVRLHGEPLGYLTVPFRRDGLDVAALAATARDRFADLVRAHLAAEGHGAVDPAGPGEIPLRTPACANHVTSDTSVTVVVCTRDRSTELVACLRRLQALTYPRLEIVVVDNAPTDDSTERVVSAVARQDARFRYVREPRPGLSAARNRGLREARGTYVAYTDDDVAVDPEWVQGIVRGFQRRHGIGCVTGLVATAAIGSAAEEYFDARAASWSTRCAPQLFDVPGRDGQDGLYPYSPGIFGTGANFAFDRDVLVGLGGFDEALGAGTRTRGGEDLDIFVRLLRAGHPIAYEPAAVVWHHHRADDAALLRQMYGYGTGLTAFMTKCLLQPGTRREVVRRVPLGLRRMANIGTETTTRLDDQARPPKGALTQEWRGFAAGPVLYLRSRRSATRAATSGSTG
jgi:GT2 family glycosyltransferase